MQRTLTILISLCTLGLFACMIAFVYYLHAATAAWSPSGPGDYVALKARSTLFAEISAALLVAVVLLLAVHAHATGQHREDVDEG